MSETDKGKITPNEAEALTLLWCNSFPILGVVDEFIVDTRNKYRREAREADFTRVWLRHDLFPKLMEEIKELGLAQRSSFIKWDSKKLFVNDIYVCPVVITAEAIQRDPSIQYLFYTDAAARRLYGI